jgi:effector-binding domain-containing protein
MKIVKVIGLIVVALVAIFIVLGLIGPADYKVTRSIQIEAPVEIVVEQTSKFQNWSTWSPWAAADPEAKYTIENDTQEEGAKMTWDGEVSGVGYIIISKIVPNEKMVYELTFTEPWVMSSEGGVNYTQEEGVVNLEWYDEGHVPFAQRPMMLFMNLEEMMGPQFEEGLINIKKICEDRKSAIEVTEELVTSKTILYISESSSLMPAEMGMKLGSAFGEIMALMGVAKIEMTSVPMSITTLLSMEEMKCNFDAAIVAELPKGMELSGRIKQGKTYAGKALKTIHIGPYTNLKATYDGILAYIKANGYEINGNSWEEYIDDPTVVSEEELRTNIYFPVK